MSIGLALGTHLGRAGAVAASVGALAPDRVAGLALWLKADSLSLNDGDPVSTWTDSSGNGRDATGSGAARPLYKTAIVNGLPVVRFDGVDDLLTVASTDFGGTGALSVFVVTANVTAGVAGMLLEHSANSGANDAGWKLGRDATNSTTTALVHQASGGVNASHTSESAASAITIWVTTDPRLVTARFNTALGQQEATVYVDGIIGGGTEAGFGTRTDGDITTTFPQAYALNIGNRADGTIPLPGDIGEIAIYHRDLTYRERVRVQLGLMRRWDLVN